MTARIVPITAFAFLLATLLHSQALRAQTGATLAGTITTSSGAAVSGAKISAKNLNTGAVAEAQSDASGHFTLSSLIVGDYEVSIAAETFAPKTMKVTVAQHAGIKCPNTTTRGPIRFHKAMAWIHGPGMILTPILGALAYEQKNNGEHVHGLAAAHAPVAIVTASAFGAALWSVSLKF